jgi:hypothetical protein
MECAVSPGNSIGDLNPVNAIGCIPDIVLIMTLIGVATHNPHSPPENNVTGGVPALPGCPGLQVPLPAIHGGPNFAVAYTGEVDPVPRIPSAQQPHFVSENQGSGTISWGKGSPVRHTFPPVKLFSGRGPWDLSEEENRKDNVKH